MKIYKGYRAIIGLEVHAELCTDTKMFCRCKTSSDDEPNSNICPVCMAFPGSLPITNTKAVELAVTAGIALNCKINCYSRFDRKNYFYPDLPKAYQITQFYHPICENGFLDIKTQDNEIFRAGITRIHLEEDAGKLFHDISTNITQIDFNRSGVPLIEIVSEPCFNNSADVVEYLKKLRSVLIYSGVSKCRMNKGEFRCDVNISVQKQDDTTLGTRTEIKNLNSFKFIQNAIDAEFIRQVDLLCEGNDVIQQTLRFDTVLCKTFPMRSKENSADYRYFPEPDLKPVIVDVSYIQNCRRALPELADARFKRYTEKYLLSDTQADALTQNKEISDYFEQCLKYTQSTKTLCDLITGEVFRLIDDKFVIGISAENLACIASFCDNAVINASTAKRLVSELWNKNLSTEQYIKDNDLEQLNDEEVIRKIVICVLEQNSKAVGDFKNGKVNAKKTIVGAVMAKSKGKANPVIVQKLVDDFLSN